MNKYILSCIVCLLFACDANAASCTAAVADMINYAKSGGPERIQVSYTVKQANGLSASSTRFERSGQLGFNIPELDWNGTYLVGSGLVLFSDRWNGNGDYGNPYNINAPEKVTMYINSTGYVWIWNQTWGFWTQFQGDCNYNVMTGWGEPIGNGNGTNKAMYVLSFAKINYGYL